MLVYWRVCRRTAGQQRPCCETGRRIVLRDHLQGTTKMSKPTKAGKYQFINDESMDTTI